MKDLEQRLADLDKKTCEEAKKGIIYCEGWYVDMELAADAVEEYLEEGVSIEIFVPQMIRAGYRMEVFS